MFKILFSFNQVPADPPSIFANCRPSVVSHSITPGRNVKKRKISLKERSAFPDELSEFNDLDNISPSFDIFGADCDLSLIHI